jgi:hypothetical protein
MIVTRDKITPRMRPIIDGRIVFTDLIEAITSVVILTSREEEIIEAVIILLAFVSKELFRSKPFLYSDCKFWSNISSFPHSSLSLSGLFI